MLIDSHCHLHDQEFFDSCQALEFLNLARQDGVEKVITIGTDPEDTLAAAKFAAEHKDVYFTYGIHPSEAAKFAGKVPSIKELSARFAAENPELTQNGHNFTDKLVAIGEIGLDYHYDGPGREQQIQLFEEMLQLALDNNLPVSLHIREAFADALPVLDKFPGTKGVVHSFTGSKKELKQCLERGFYIGVNGLATYSTLPMPPLDRILLETDAPFLTPVPFRGKINSPRYVKLVAAYLAEKLETPAELIAKETTENVQRIFKL